MSNETTQPQQDLRERFESCVGALALAIASSPGTVAIGAMEDAMALLAGVEGIVCAEVDFRGDLRPEVVADLLEAFCAAGPRPPSVVRLLASAAGLVRTGEAARAEASTLEVRQDDPVSIESPGVTIVCHGPVTVNLPPRPVRAFE